MSHLTSSDPTSPSCDSARSRTNRAEEAVLRNPARINFSERLAGSRRAHLAPLDAPSKSSLSPFKIRSLREGTERRPSFGPFPPLLSPHCLTATDGQKRKRASPPSPATLPPPQAAAILLNVLVNIECLRSPSLSYARTLFYLLALA